MISPRSNSFQYHPANMGAPPLRPHTDDTITGHSRNRGCLSGHRALTHSPRHTDFCCLRRSHLTLLVVDRSMVLEPTGLVDKRPTCPTKWQILLADLLVDSRPLCVSFPLCPVLPRPLLLSHSSHHLFALLELTLLHAASSFCLRCRTMATASSSFVSMSTHRRRI